MRAVDERPQHGDFGVSDSRIIAPGDPSHSVIITRMSLRGPGQMPPAGTRVADSDGLRLMAEWIQSIRKP